MTVFCTAGGAMLCHGCYRSATSTVSGGTPVRAFDGTVYRTKTIKGQLWGHAKFLDRKRMLNPT